MSEAMSNELTTFISIDLDADPLSVKKNEVPSASEADSTNAGQKETRAEHARKEEDYDGQYEFEDPSGVSLIGSTEKKKEQTLNGDVGKSVASVISNIHKATTCILFLIVVILLIVLFSTTSNLVYFHHYTAECRTYFYNGDFSGIKRIEQSKEVVFSDYRWLREGYYEKQLISREFSTKEDDTVTVCEHVGNHDNCYVLSSGDYGSFFIPMGAKKEEIEDDVCKLLSLRTNGRKFKKCEAYIYTPSKDFLVKRVTVERDTKYPILVETMEKSSGATVTETLFLTFNPENPTDESGLKPFNDTKVYDFRNGKGDAGKGNNNAYTEASKTESVLNSLLNMFRLKHRKSSRNKESEKDHDSLDVYTRSINRNLQLRNMLHLPPMGLPSNYLVHSSKSIARDIKEIPTSFDARTKWASCKSIIGNITDQGSCGSCWAMAASGVLADRYCIATGKKRQLSAQYLVYCAPHNNGCSGAASEIGIWEDIKSIGIPSESCVPFQGYNGVCPTRCQNGTLITKSMKIFPSGYTIPWGRTDDERVKAIQKEIMANGPVEAFFLVFSDFQEFFLTSSGIYHRSSTATYDSVSHAIRIIGWGTEAGQDYWLIANSYGTDYPAEGLFRMRRGNNECNIEEKVAAGAFY